MTNFTCAQCQAPRAFALCQKCNQNLCYDHFIQHIQAGHVEYLFSTPTIPEILRTPCCIRCAQMDIAKLYYDSSDEIPILCCVCIQKYEPETTKQRLIDNAQLALFAIKVKPISQVQKQYPSSIPVEQIQLKNVKNQNCIAKREEMYQVKESQQIIQQQLMNVRQADANQERMKKISGRDGNKKLLRSYPNAKMRLTQTSLCGFDGQEKIFEIDLGQPDIVEFDDQNMKIVVQHDEGPFVIRAECQSDYQNWVRGVTKSMQNAQNHNKSNKTLIMKLDLTKKELYVYKNENEQPSRVFQVHKCLIEYRKDGINATIKVKCQDGRKFSFSDKIEICQDWVKKFQSVGGTVTKNE